MPTINKRVEELEKNIPTTNGSHYKMVVTMGETHIETQYFRDGERITRAEYEREAPKEPGKIVVDWSTSQPGGSDANNK